MWDILPAIIRYCSERQMPLVEQELLTIPEHLSSTPVLSGVHVTRFFFWPLCCLFFDMRILITPLTSSYFVIYPIYFQYSCEDSVEKSGLFYLGIYCENFCSSIFYYLCIFMFLVYLKFLRCSLISTCFRYFLNLITGTYPRLLNLFHCITSKVWSQGLTLGH